MKILERRDRPHPIHKLAQARARISNGQDSWANRIVSTLAWRIGSEGRILVEGSAARIAGAGEDGVGDYLVCDVAGPGAIVRGWSAGMGGTLRVVLDGAEEPLYEGPAYDFLADRTRVFLERVGLDETMVEDMYRIMALANYEDRYVIPTNHREYAGQTPFDNEIAFEHRSACGFSFGNGCSDGNNEVNMFGAKRTDRRDIIQTVQVNMKQG